MTKIDIFSGFLGAGKTTLIKKLITESFAGQKIVLIENEFGEIGIDGGFLAEAGVQINEMNSGCICCSLVGDFCEALKKVVAEYAPDRILIEPSGVGKLSDVTRAVESVAAELDVQLNSFVTVADVGKVKLYTKNFGEFYNDQIEHASCIILSRTADVPEVKIALATALIREKNAAANIITTAWDKLDGAQILAAMEGENALNSELLALAAEANALAKHAQEHEHHHEHAHGEGCGCGGHGHGEHGEHGHEHGEHCCCGSHGEHAHHEHEHHHEHAHGEGCGCGGHGHGEHPHHPPHGHPHGEHPHHPPHHPPHGVPPHHPHPEHGEGCGCGGHGEHAHGHEHGEHCCCGGHGEHAHHEHEHHHEHAHGEGCGCGCGGHGEHHHHADEVFTSWGTETANKTTKAALEANLAALDSGDYGMILRAKGIVDGGDGWYEFDYVPGEINVRPRKADITGKLVVIGANMDEAKVAVLFGC